MRTHRLLLLRWKNEKNETRTANLYLYTSNRVYAELEVSFGPLLPVLARDLMASLTILLVAS